MPRIPEATDPLNRYKRGYGQPQGGITQGGSLPVVSPMSKMQRRDRLRTMDPAQRTGESIKLGLVTPEQAKENMEAWQPQDEEPETAFSGLNRRRRPSRRGY